MVALKAELSAVVPGVPGVSLPYWTVSVGTGSDTLPGTGTSLGTFEHNSATDPVHKGLNHVVYHHVRDILYRRQLTTPANQTPPAQAVPPASMYTGPAPNSMWPYGFHDMQSIKIVRFGPIMTSTHMTCAPVTMAVAATATLAPKYEPGAVTAAVADQDFVSLAPAIATVAATGVVTGVSPGSTNIRITNKFNGLVVDAGVVVTGTMLREGEDLSEQRVRDDDEQYDNPIVKPQVTGSQSHSEPHPQSQKAESKAQDTRASDTKAKEKHEEDEDDKKKSHKK